MHDFQKGMSDVHVAMHARVWGSGGILPCLNFCFVVVVVVIVFFLGKLTFWDLTSWQLTFLDQLNKSRLE